MVWEIPLAKHVLSKIEGAQRRQVRSCCHFDRREKSFFRSLDFARDDGHRPVTFAVLASLREIIRIPLAAVRRQANLFFPARSREKRVLLSVIICAACANCPGAETPRIRIFLAPRTPRSQSWEFIYSVPLRPLRALREIFRISVAAVPR